MHIVKLLHNYLKKALPNIHLKRLERLILTAASLLHNGTLTLTGLARHSKGDADVKHKIKAVDRLLSNSALYNEQIAIYQAIASRVIGYITAIDILVDWSTVVAHETHMLRASVVIGGRATTIYQEIHPEKKLGTYKVHKSFLNNLKKMLPPTCAPTIITDAGFRTEWFELVAKQGWDFEGRLLSNMAYSTNGTKWKECNFLYKEATATPRYIGNVLLTKARELPCEMYLYSEKKARAKACNHKKKRKKKNQKHDKEHRKSFNTPWLLVTSKKHKKHNAKAVVKKYARRMKIEHDFRDTKDPKWGIGLSQTRTRDIKRLAILLLIGTLGLLMLWLIGLAAEMKNLHFRFQANTIKNRRVLSLVFLGKQVVEHALEKLDKPDYIKAFKGALNVEQENQNALFA